MRNYFNLKYEFVILYFVLFVFSSVYASDSFCLAPLSKTGSKDHVLHETFMVKTLTLLSEDESRTEFPEILMKEMEGLFLAMTDKEKVSVLRLLMRKNMPNGRYFIKALVEHRKIAALRDQIPGLNNLLSRLEANHTERYNHNTSCFYDDAFALDWLIPDIIVRLKSGDYDSSNKMRIVSLGASRLQEAYSILMELMRDYEASPDQWKNSPFEMISVICIEKDSKVLQEGLSGRFLPFDVIHIRHKPWYFSFFGRYIPDQTQKEGRHTDVTLLKKTVLREFLKVIIPVCADFIEMEDSRAENADYILFNGVSIYLDDFQKDIMARKISRWLNQGGTLFTTAAEKYFNPPGLSLFPRDFIHTKAFRLTHVFQKKEDFLSVSFNSALQVLQAA